MLIAFASDYGLADEFVGVCKAVMLGIAPDARIVDLAHDIPPHDVRAGALLIVRAIQYLPEGSVVVAVVDPGVGTDRRLVGVEVEGGIVLGPDNGLLAPAVAMVGGPRRVVSLENREYQLEAPGATFAGRDILAPAAGHLAAGGDLGALGPEVDPAGLVPGVVSLPEARPGGAIAAEVWWVDRFGNCQLNVDPDVLVEAGTSPGSRVEVRFAHEVRAARWVRTYADAKPSELVLVVDSYGLLSLALDRESAATTFGLRAGSAVNLVPEGASEPVNVDAPETRP
ncbi:MAG TPA: SAM-dependent chlorinase/fluorinase [Acidimicrobiia bacterium]|nr:SAM-dependent chlorinase/fluorinase [Acidimicrobiia bacterium]